MSTLGSMARAAEYAAAQSARARQVSRETEEQKLPPKSTPVSLSAFTKGQPTTRNKGNKAWKPLTADDLGGDTEYSDNPTSREQTPFYPDNDEELRSTRHLLNRPAQGSSEELKIPTAPKAMLIQRDRPAIRLNPAPRQVSTHQVINYQHQQNLQTAEGISGRDTQGRLLLNIPQPPQRPSRRQRAAYLHDMQYLDSHADRPDTMPAHPMFGYELYPATYLTPNREAIAEVIRERNCQHMLNMANLQPSLAQQQAPPPFTGFHESPVHYYSPGDYDLIAYPQVHPPSYDITPPAFYPAQQSNTRIDAPNAFQSTPPRYQAPRNNTNQLTALCHPEYRKPDIPYDRARMMEQYKATLAKAALEKKGKTVLHNPELHKSQGNPHEPTSDHVVTNKQAGEEEINEDAVPWSELEGMLEQEKELQDASCDHTNESKKSAQEPSYNMYKTVQTDIFASNTNAERILLIGPPPGLELPTDGSGDTEGNMLREFPDDFYTLKPLSVTEVKRVRQLAQEARDNLAGTFKQPFLHEKPGTDLKGTIRHPLFSTKDGENINSFRVKEAESWFHGPKLVEDTARCNELAAHMHECAVRDKAITEKSGDEMIIERALIGNVISKVIGNVKHIWEECKLPDDKRTLPFKIKPVPEYAIERPSVMTGGASIFSSFFEETSTKGEAEKAFIPTPKRIARDPRFRPAAPKEGLKLVIEEERLARRDSYGRRVAM